MTSRTVTTSLAEFVHAASLDDIPPRVRERATLHLLDALGIAIASSTMDFGSAVHSAAQQLGASQEAHALGFGTALPAASAALVNGTLIHGLDFDDTHIEAVHHATAPALAAALAVGESEGSDGESTLLAYIIGLELGCRLALAAPGAFHDRGFHPTGIVGTFAAACVAGKLRGLAVPDLVSALGLCGSQAAGILEIRQSWLKRFHPGWAAHSGIVAVALAQAGFRGPATVLEGTHGLYASHLGEVPVGVETLGDGLGADWRIEGIALKPYPCCHFLHAFIDAALELREQEDIDPAEVDRIDCPISDRVAPVVASPASLKVAPPTIYDALFSVQYTVALALLRGRVDLAAFYDEPLDAPDVLDLARRVRCPSDPDSDYPRHFPGEVVVQLADGRVLRRRVATSLGTPERPMSREQVVAKFHDNAARELSPEAAARAAEHASGLADLDHIGDLVLSCGKT